MSCDDREWLEARLAKTEELIVAYEDAILALSTGTVQSYSLDTGQTRQTVTKQQLSQIKNTLDSLENRRAVLRAQLGCGTVNVRPAY
jgi:hypothetical protein